MLVPRIGYIFSNWKDASRRLGAFSFMADEDATATMPGPTESELDDTQVNILPVMVFVISPEQWAEYISAVRDFAEIDCGGGDN